MLWSLGSVVYKYMYSNTETFFLMFYIIESKKEINKHGLRAKIYFTEYRLNI